ncbi:phosphoribosylglycinamide formyltransferase [Bordetella holmesii]|nr:phosphoribosylglycinamide formyltransferase [Bordetella holmesii]
MAPVHPIEVADGQGTGGALPRGRQVVVDAQQWFHVQEFTILGWLALEFLILSPTQSTPCRFVILISGRGSNMQSLVQSCEEQAWPAQVAAVIASRPDAAGLEWAAG